MAEAKEIVKVDKQFTRAKLDVSTFDRDKRTVEVTFATETPVRTYDWEVGTFKEILSCDPAHVDLTRMKSGAPVLDNHNKYGEVRKMVVGVVEDAWIAEGVCRARLRFSKSKEDTELMDKVAEGIITGVSAGYDVYAYELTRASLEGELPTYKAVNWQPTEISFVAVQADVNSRTRSEDTTAHEATVQDVTPDAEAPVQNTDPNPNKENNSNSNKNEMAEEVNTPAANPAPAPATPPATPEGMDQARSAARAEERQRIETIRSVTRSLKLPETFSETLIKDDNVDVNVARERALAEWEKLNPVNAHPQANQPKTDMEKTRSAMADSLVLRIDPKSATVMGEERVRAASEFKGQSLLRLAEEALIREGVRTAGFVPREIATMALGGKVRGLHHTTDFPQLLLSTVNRTLLAQYQLQERTFQNWARRTTLKDFRPVSRVRLSEILGDLEKVREGEEYKYGTLSESGETYQLAKYGKIIAITWESIVNDDLSAFDRIPQAFAVKAANLQTELVYKTILASGFSAMSDGNALFSAAHGNYTGTANNQTAGGTALSEATLAAAYTSFRTQKGLDGSKLNIKPKFLVVGPKLEFTAQKLTSVNFTAAKQSDTPIGALTGLTVIIDAEIENYEWFLIADPNAIDTVEYAFLDGEEELFIEQREGFNIDGIEVKARTVFAAKAIDWRGVYRNNGAAPA